jgi:hypothetical protein
LQPTPEPQPALEAVAHQRATLAAIVNPSILLLDSHRSHSVLLSRNTQIEHGLIHLHGTRLIKIPLGWRLSLIRLLSRFYKVRLPSEREFASLQIATLKSPSPVSSDGTLIGQVTDLSTLIQLTGTEYRSLCNMNGRMLHCWVENRFSVRHRVEIILRNKRGRAA